MNLNKIKNAMNNTWDAIGSDVLELSGGEVNKDLVIEMVLDAGRMGQFGFLDEDE